MARRKYSVKEVLTDLLEVFIISTVVFIIVYLYVGQLLEVTGESMDPTFVDKEQIIAEKISIKFKELERGEIVIFKHPEYNNKLIIKRIVGLPGEEVTITRGDVYINGQLLDESYLGNSVKTKPSSEISEGEKYIIPENEYVLLGDNRENSNDSRDWGTLSKDLITGRAFLVYYPLSDLRLVKN